MKILIPLVILFVLAACGGTLSDEQRKKMKEQMELHKIRKVSEAEITEAAFSRGRQLAATLEGFHGDSLKIDSLNRTEGGRIHWMVPGKTTALALEQQLIDAYLASPDAPLQDNVQKIRNPAGDSDSILYSKPVVTKAADGTERLLGVWNIWLSQKQLILAMKKK